jgi:hypothetical protein
VGIGYIDSLGGYFSGINEKILQIIRIFRQELQNRTFNP